MNPAGQGTQSIQPARHAGEVFGGEALFGFSIALFIGVLAGTYSSIYIANVVLIWLNLTTEDLIPPANTEKEVDDRP